jgi:hypothetical protein
MFPVLPSVPAILLGKSKTFALSIASRGESRSEKAFTKNFSEYLHLPFATRTMTYKGTTPWPWFTLREAKIFL